MASEPVLASEPALARTKEVAPAVPQQSRPRSRPALPRTVTPRRKKSLFERVKETALMALGQDDDADYECTRG
jgi:hypothetical protein